MSNAQFIVNSLDWGKLMGSLSHVQSAGAWDYLSINCQDDQLHIVAKNDDASEICTLEALVKSPGEIHLPFASVSAVSKHGDQTVEFIEFEEGGEPFCKIKTGETEFNLKLVDQTKRPDNFFRADLSGPIDATFRIDQSMLSRIVNRSLWFSTDDDAKANVLKGIYLFMRAGKLMAISTNAEVWSICECDVHTYDEIHDFATVIPKKTVEQLKRRQSERGLWRVSIMGESCNFSINGQKSISSKTLPPEVEMMDKFENGIKPTNQSFRVWKDNIKQANYRMMALHTERIRAIKFDVSESGIRLSTANPSKGKGEEDLEMEGLDALSVNGAFEFGISARYLEKILDSLTAPQIEIGYNASSEPIHFQDEYRGVKTRYLVCPMRV